MPDGWIFPGAHKTDFDVLPERLFSSVMATASMPHSDLKGLALLIAVNCVRNTIIEDFHSDGKLSDTEMKALNQEVTDKIYTFLYYLFEKPGEDQEAFLSAMGMMFPSNWDKPKLDADFVKAVDLVKKMGKPIEHTFGRSPPHASQLLPKEQQREKGVTEGRLVVPIISAFNFTLPQPC